MYTLVSSTTLIQVHFESAFRIKANGEFIDVNTGHAAPYFTDFDGDGVKDLLVGDVNWDNVLSVRTDLNAEEQAEFEAFKARTDSINEEIGQLCVTRDLTLHRSERNEIQKKISALLKEPGSNY